MLSISTKQRTNTLFKHAEVNSVYCCTAAVLSSLNATHSPNSCTYTNKRWRVTKGCSSGTYHILENMNHHQPAMPEPLILI